MPAGKFLVLALLSTESVAAAREVSDVLGGKPLGEAIAASNNDYDAGVSQSVHERLANGLDVLIAVRKGVPMVGIHVFFRVPEALDPPDAPDLSKLIARLWQEADTRHLSAASRKQLISAADTWFATPEAKAGTDEFDVSLVVPREALELAMFIEADRIGFATQGVTESLVAQAQQALKDNAGKLDPLVGLLHWATFGSGHPYATAARPIAERKFDQVSVKSHLSRYFHAGNATVVVVGDVEPKRVLESVRRTFGHLCGGQRVEWKSTGLQPHAQVQVRLEDDVPGHSLMAWQSPAYMTEDDARCDVLSQILSRRLRDVQKDLCKRAWAYQWSRELVSAFTVACEFAQNYDSATWQATVEGILKEIADGKFTSEEAALARNNYLGRVFPSLDGPGWPGPALFKQLAQDLPLRAAEGYFAHYSQASAANIAGLVKQYLLRPADALVEGKKPAWLAAKQLKGFTGITYVAPLTTRGAECQDDHIWYQPPRVASPVAPDFPLATTEVLPRNLVLRHVEQHGSPITSLRLRFALRQHDVDPLLATVAFLELQDQDGIGNNLASSLLSDFGVSMNWFANSNTASIDLVGPTDQFAGALISIRELLKRSPSLTATLETAKRKALAQTSNHNDSLGNLLGRRFGSPSLLNVDARRLVATSRRVESITRARVSEYWQRLATEAERHVSIVGPVSKAQAKELAQMVVPESWPGARERSARVWPVKPRIWVIDDPRAKLVSLHVRWPIDRRRGDNSAALTLEGLSVAAKQLGNVNAARPSNPTTQFILRATWAIDSNCLAVDVGDLDSDQIATKLQELDGYFTRLVERSDYSQLARLGSHYLQRALVSSVASQPTLLNILDGASYDNISAAHAFEEYQHLGSAPRDAVGRLARTLKLERAVFIVKGTESRLRPEFAALGHAQWIVLPDEAR